MRPTSYVWEDGDGVKHLIHQAEGGEQGDPLMPLVFCLTVHDALANVQMQLREGGYIFALLDDVYVVTAQTARAQHTTCWLNSCGLSQASVAWHG